jgi:phage/plasmid-associated DNA primase
MKPIYESGNMYTVVDVYNKRRYLVTKYLEFMNGIRNIDGPFHYAEMPLYPSPILIDIDLKEVDDGTDDKLYDDNMVKEIIDTYVSVLDENLEIRPEKYCALLLEKPMRVVEDGQGVKYKKNGFHIHFISVALNKDDHKIILQKVKEESQYSRYIDDVQTKPWLIYGATKSPEDVPYSITKAYVSDVGDLKEEPEWTKVFIGHSYFEETITEDNIYDMLPNMMSVRNVDNFSLTKCENVAQVTLDTQEERQHQQGGGEEEVEEQIVDGDTNHINLSDENISRLVHLLPEEYAADYNNWLKVGMILTNLSKQRDDDVKEYYKGMFLSFSSKCKDKYEPAQTVAKWDSLMKTNNYGKSLGVGSLIYIARTTGVLPNIKEFLFGGIANSAIPTYDYTIAEAVKSTVTDLYMTHKDYGCYKFDVTVWREIQGWECVFQRHIFEWFNGFKRHLGPVSDMEEDRQKVFKSLERKIMNFSSLNNIVKAMFCLYFDPNVDKLFDQQEHRIAFKNCVFDVKQWAMIDPSPYHYFSSRIEHDYVSWDNTPEESKEFVLDFFAKIFPDEGLRSYSVTNLGRIITGLNKLKQFQFWTGTGNNGKSMMVTVLEQLLGHYVRKTPKAIIANFTQKQGGTNPELARLKNARLAVIDEVTNNDILNPGQIKALSGNDKLYARDLYENSKQIKDVVPMFFPILITNETPIISKPDTATWDRIRLIRFESIFTNDVDGYIRDHPDCDPTKVFKIDHDLSDNVKEHARFFLSYILHTMLQYKSVKHLNAKEDMPDKVIEGLTQFKYTQNIMKRFLEENYVPSRESTEVISLRRILKEYNASKPQVILDLSNVHTALMNYSKLNPEIVLTDTHVKGLAKVTF